MESRVAPRRTTSEPRQTQWVSRRRGGQGLPGWERGEGPEGADLSRWRGSLSERGTSRNWCRRWCTAQPPQPRPRPPRILPPSFALFNPLLLLLLLLLLFLLLLPPGSSLPPSHRLPPFLSSSFHYRHYPTTSPRTRLHASVDHRVVALWTLSCDLNPIAP